MLDIDLKQVSKRYVYEWIFKNIDFSMRAGDKLAISGPNGSGKSTLLRILLGSIDPSSGIVDFQLNQKKLAASAVFKYVSFSAPYMEIIENFTAQEIINFHFQYKTPFNTIKAADILKLCQLENHQNKLIRNFSSGMKQRLKLGLAIFSNSELLILDEPSTNLDEAAKLWWQEMTANYLGDRTLIIASNEASDLALTTKSLNILDFK